MFLKTKNFIILLASAGMLLMLVSTSSYAIPSFARQTNLACSVCHYLPTNLTPFGRLFKLNGYTMTNIATIQSTYKGRTDLNLLKALPVTVNFQTSYTSIAKNIPGQQNNTVEFPQELGLYFSGEITPHIGAFLQISYDDQGGGIELDMTDIRYANHATLGNKDLLYGISFNNAPAMQDIWNTGPQWSFPFVGSGVATTPTAGTMMESMMNVMGFGGYALYDNLIYGGLSFYRTVNQGGPIPPDASAQTTISGVAPYWRLALQHQWGNQYVEVGTYGIAPKVYPAGITGKTDNYTDLAFDAQYENSFNHGALIAHVNFIKEKQELNATYAAGNSENASNNLNSLRVDATYYLKTGYGFTVGYFNINGTKDTKLYRSAPINGSMISSPNSSGVTLQFTFVPWQNTQFALQYVAYNKFNGSNSNYDGSGRNASDNNTLYLNSWLMF
jgi:hypothetical protein